MPQGRWNLPDAAIIAARLIGLLPARPARAGTRAGTKAGILTAAGAANWVPSTRNAVVLVCIALGIVYAVATLMHPASSRVDGGDIGSFTAPARTAPALGDAPQTGAPTPR
jgi:hypothetical protein